MNLNGRLTVGCRLGALLLISFVWACGEDDSGGTIDPCESVTCGAHGSCDQGSCVCTDGYTGTYCDTQPTPTGASCVIVTGMTSLGGDVTTGCYEYEGPDATTFVSQGCIAGTTGMITRTPVLDSLCSRTNAVAICWGSIGDTIGRNVYYAGDDLTIAQTGCEAQGRTWETL